MIKATFFGRVTNDPETAVRFAPDGTPVLNLRLAVKNGITREGETKTLFVNVSCWRKLAETQSKYLRKGDGIVVTATLTGPRAWQGNDGVVHPEVDFEAEDIEWTTAVAARYNAEHGVQAQGNAAPEGNAARPTVRIASAQVTRSRNGQQAKPAQTQPAQAQPAPQAVEEEIPF